MTFQDMIKPILKKFLNRLKTSTGATSACAPTKTPRTSERFFSVRLLIAQSASSCLHCRSHQLNPFMVQVLAQAWRSYKPTQRLALLRECERRFLIECVCSARVRKHKGLTANAREKELKLRCDATLHLRDKVAVAALLVRRPTTGSRSGHDQQGQKALLTQHNLF